jgi:hypothetical protein
VHQGWPLSSNFSRDIPQRKQAPRLKLKRWPPALRLKPVISKLPPVLPSPQIIPDLKRTDQ